VQQLLPVHTIAAEGSGALPVQQLLVEFTCGAAVNGIYMCSSL